MRRVCGAGVLPDNLFHASRAIGLRGRARAPVRRPPGKAFERFGAPAVSAPATRTDEQALRELLRSMSVEAQLAFLARGFGPAITARLASVENVSPRAAGAGTFGGWLVAILDHAGLDASMLELFHVAGGVPWRRCLSVARATHIPLTDAPPEPGAPAEHARGAVVVTVDGPPDRQRWSTRALLGALQGLHRRLEAQPELRSPAARPLLAGVSEDERHLVLRADGPTTAALLALSPEELSTVTGLPVRSIAGERAAVRSHRPVVLGLVVCALLLLASLVGKQWQLAHLWTAVRAQAAVSSLAAPSSGTAVEGRPAEVTEAEVTEAGASVEAVPPLSVEASPEVPGAAGSQVPEAPPVDAPSGGALASQPWVQTLQSTMRDSGATVEVRSDVVSVAFSDELLAFAPGAAALSDPSRRPIRKVAEFLRRNPALYVWVEGHTDDASFSNGNWLLGAQRALAVVEALTVAGVSPGRVVLTSHGEHRPVAPNSTAEGRRRNRRVELVLSETPQR